MFYIYTKFIFACKHFFAENRGGDRIGPPPGPHLAKKSPVQVGLKRHLISTDSTGNLMESLHLALFTPRFVCDNNPVYFASSQYN